MYITSHQGKKWSWKRIDCVSTITDNRGLRKEDIYEIFYPDEWAKVWKTRSHDGRNIGISPSFLSGIFSELSMASGLSMRSCVLLADLRKEDRITEFNERRLEANLERRG